MALGEDAVQALLQKVQTVVVDDDRRHDGSGRARVGGARTTLSLGRTRRARAILHAAPAAGFRAPMGTGPAAGARYRPWWKV
jgi:hypothetical protein